MTGSHTRRGTKRLALALTGLLAIACGDDPLSSGPGGTTSIVRFDLADRTLSSGLKICSEGDAVSLETRQDGRVTPQQKDPDSTCGATFQVRINKGKRVDFTGEIAGNGRPLLRGSATLPADQAVDGFRVDIALSEIPALRVTTETLGFGGPDRYHFRVGPDGEPVPIGPDTTVTVGAVAAGPDRRVTLDAGDCFINQDTVTVPVPEDSLAHAFFREIDCTGPGDLTARIRSTGACTATSYTITITQIDPAATPYTETRTVGPNDDVTFDDLPPGNYRVQLDTGSGIQPPDQIIFLPTGGSVTVDFDIDCPEGTIEVITLTTGPQRPTSYQYRVDTDPLRAILANDTTYESVAAGDHLVQLVGIPSNCTLNDPPSNPTSVNVPAGDTATVRFLVGCVDIPTATGQIRLTTTTVGGGTPTASPYTFEVRDVNSTLIRSGQVGLNADTLLLFFNLQDNPYEVTLLVGTCIPITPPETQPTKVTVDAQVSPAAGLAAFVVECGPNQSP